MNLIWRMLWAKWRTPFRSRVDIWDVVVTPFRVWPSDLDVLMHMNNSKYLALMDIARMDLMYRSGVWKKISAQGWYPVVAGQTISYFSSLNPWKTFDVKTQLLGLDDKWVYLEQKFYSEGKLHAHAIVRTRFLKKSGGSVTHTELEELLDEVAEQHTIPAWIIEWSKNSKPPVP